MVSFSKFITGQRNCQQLLDTDGYIYIRRKDKDTLHPPTTAWRCTKNRSLKCACHVWFNPEDESLCTRETKPHNHEPEPLVEQKRSLVKSLERKAVEQNLSSTQNLLTRALATSNTINVCLPNLESLGRIGSL